MTRISPIPVSSDLDPSVDPFVDLDRSTGGVREVWTTDLVDPESACRSAAASRTKRRVAVGDGGATPRTRHMVCKLANIARKNPGLIAIFGVNARSEGAIHLASSI